MCVFLKANETNNQQNQLETCSFLATDDSEVCCYTENERISALGVLTC